MWRGPRRSRPFQKCSASFYCRHEVSRKNHQFSLTFRDRSPTAYIEPLRLGKEGCPAFDAVMLGLDGYGSSSDEEESENERVVAAPTALGTSPSSNAPNSNGTAATADAPRSEEEAGAPSTSAAATHSRLPSAAAMLESSGKGVGSAGSSFSQVGTGAGTKRPASGSFPIPDVKSKSGRSGQQTHAHAKTTSTLLPPQLRGRSNNATQDLEGMGLKRRPGPS